MSDFKFVSGGKELIDSVQPLWEKLNKHHESNSIYFPEKYRNQTFENRKAKFMDNDNLEIMIDLIMDEEKKAYIGYCISTINKDMIGEIDSLFVEEEYRKYGFGESLMKRALNFLDSKNVKSKIIVVAGGNEKVLEFYKKYGFEKRRIVLEQIKE